ncbi:phosphotransferase family protein [Micromonospora auratinigra]
MLPEPYDNHVVAAISLPPVPYDGTAVRPGWAALPAGLRDAIAARIGGPPTTVRVAGAGFTRGFAALLTGPDGERTFVKAAALDGQRHLADWYFHEANVLARLPADLPVPRPRWALAEAGWYALALTAVDGHLPRLPWNPAELDAALGTYAEVAAALADPPAPLLALELPHLADLARDDLLSWRDVAAGRARLPWDAPPGRLPSAAPAGTTAPAASPEPVEAGRQGPGRPPHVPLSALVTLESRLPGYAAGGGLAHGDLRVDNLLIGHDGRAWLCDWTWLCHGPAWFDLVSLLITGYASGLDADAAFAGHPAAAQAPADALDVTLAALSGYFLTSATAGPSSASPHLRAHQRWSGEQAFSWLAARQGWT